MDVVPPPARPILRPIVEQHAEDAAFLWHLRDRAADAPHYGLAELARLDGRVEAHVDGLRIAGEAGLEIAQAQLDRFPEAGESFVCAVLALDRDDAVRLDQLVELGTAFPEVWRGLGGALAWLPAAALGGRVRDWLDDADPGLRRLALEACGEHRVDLAERLAASLRDPVPAVRARALRLAGELGRRDLAGEVQAALAAGDPELVIPAAIACGLLGATETARPVLTDLVHGAGADADAAVELLARAGSTERSVAWIRALNGEPERRRLVAVALGRMGDPAAAPWLLAALEEPALARAAAQSLALIGGLDLERDDLAGPPPPRDDAAEEDPTPDPDEGAPWPDPFRVAAWWDRNARHLRAGERYLLGAPAGVAAAEHAFATGRQLQRRSAAFELAAHGHPLPAWRARLR